MTFEPTLGFAQYLDQQDPLRSFRKEFVFPEHQGRNTLYFCGNSLGLMPKAANTAVECELERWGALAVKGHFTGDPSWMNLPKLLVAPTAHIVGAREKEVVIMNTLSVNLHLMMVSFYRPDAKRYKIIMEAGAFPSDQYAVASHVRSRGLDPEKVIVELAPRPGEDTLRMEDIAQAIEREGEKTALVLFPGIQYYTGQFFDLQAIVQAAHQVGAYVGFDLAHAAGNVSLKLHDWGADFAVWCTYKYLNGGPGALSGVFVHERHALSSDIPRFAGWWGHSEERRFLMEKDFEPIPGAAGWQLSTPPTLAFAAMLPGHELFAKATMPVLREKSIRLTAYLEFFIDRLREAGHNYRIITPREAGARGCQLSLLTGAHGRQLFNYLASNGVICDWREPNVIRLAPTPMYNSFQDVYEVGALLENYLK